MAPNAVNLLIAPAQAVVVVISQPLQHVGQHAILQKRDQATCSVSPGHAEEQRGDHHCEWHPILVPRAYYLTLYTVLSYIFVMARPSQVQR